MFQQTFVPDAPSARRPVGLAVSLITQCLLLALLALAPLFMKQPLPTRQLRLLLLGPTPPIAPDKPTMRTSSAVTQINVVRSRSFHLVAPVVIPKQIGTPVEGPPEAPDVTVGAGLTVGDASLLSGLSVLPGTVAPPMPKPQPKTKEQTGPLAIGGNVAAANLIHRVEPIYPPLARSARVQGVVVFQATIGADGQIRDLQLQEGHPLLVLAAKSAILQWRYRPTMLNGKPVEVLTTITVHFSLSQ